MDFEQIPHHTMLPAHRRWAAYHEIVVLLQIRRSEARTILSRTSGFIAEAGFTHSLTPARNCTFGCTYCYVPTMRIQAGLKREDWNRWGQFTTFKTNAAELLFRQAQGEEKIYCSPLVDPYQPPEEQEQLMPRILEALIRKARLSRPGAFVIQTRGPLILRDIELLKMLATFITVRVSFSVTTNREDIRRRYEPLCASIEERLSAIRALRAAGIEVYATLAPLLPCDPEELVRSAIEASGRDLIGDPLHIRSVKQRGATTRTAAIRLAAKCEETEWLEEGFQGQVVARIRAAAHDMGKQFLIGPGGFARLSQTASAPSISFCLTERAHPPAR